MSLKIFENRSNVADDHAYIAPIVETAIINATKEINLYLSRKYSLPIATPYPVLKDWCMKLTMFHLNWHWSFYYGADMLARYRNETLRQLENIVTGKRELSESNTFTLERADKQIKLLSHIRSSFQKRVIVLFNIENNQPIFYKWELGKDQLSVSNPLSLCDSNCSEHPCISIDDDNITEMIYSDLYHVVNLDLLYHYLNTVTQQ